MSHYFIMYKPTYLNQSSKWRMQTEKTMKLTICIRIPWFLIFRERKRDPAISIVLS